MAPVLALHWVATTYGTWLHGDRRGSWFRGRLIPGDAALHTRSRRAMTHDAVRLSEAEQQLVDATVRRVCQEQRHAILAMTVQPTHVHLVLGATQDGAKSVIARLKRQTSMAVLATRRDRGDQEVPRTIWTAKRFVVSITSDEQLQNTLEYVERHNQ